MWDYFYFLIFIIYIIIIKIECNSCYDYATKNNNSCNCNDGFYLVNYPDNLLTRPGSSCDPCHSTCLTCSSGN